MGQVVKRSKGQKVEQLYNHLPNTSTLLHEYHVFLIKNLTILYSSLFSIISSSISFLFPVQFALTSSFLVSIIDHFVFSLLLFTLNIPFPDCSLYCSKQIRCGLKKIKNTAKRNMSNTMCTSSMYSRLCMDMLSFLFVRVWTMPHILYLSCGIPFSV